jgi:hypothetical protein
MRPVQKLPVPQPFLAFAWETSGECSTAQAAIAGLWFLYPFRRLEVFNKRAIRVPFRSMIFPVAARPCRGTGTPLRFASFGKGE